MSHSDRVVGLDAGVRRDGLDGVFGLLRIAVCERELVSSPSFAVAASVSQANPGANVKVNIAAGDLGLQQQAGRWMDKLDIFFIQRDDAGLHAHIEGQTLGLRLKSATYERLLPTAVPFAHFVGVKPGTASLRVLVVDENSGRMGSVTIPVSEFGVGQ